MKVCITGHNYGIGKAIAETFIKNGFSVEGFSRSNGYDISNEEDRLRIIEKSLVADVFVNNAYHPVGQPELLEKLTEEYTGTIINVSSKLSFFPLGKGYDEYILSKQRLNNFIKKRIFNQSPRILNVITGLVDTDMAKVFEAKKIVPADLANLIYDLFKYKDLVSVQEIIVDAPGLDWNNIKRV